MNPVGYIPHLFFSLKNELKIFPSTENHKKADQPLNGCFRVDCLIGVLDQVTIVFIEFQLR